MPDIKCVCGETRQSADGWNAQGLFTETDETCTSHVAVGFKGGTGEHGQRLTCTRYRWSDEKEVARWNPATKAWDATKAALRLLVLSDIHVEFHRDGGRSFIDSLPEADVAVLPGDIVVTNKSTDALKWFCEKYLDVVFLAGNHEYYGSSVARTHACLEAFSAQHKNFHWLRDSTCEIAGQRFIGGTLWFGKFPGMNREWLNDFHVIKGFEPWVYEQNAGTLAYLRHEVLATDIVLTHHLPSWNSVDPQFAGSPYNGFFVCPEAETIIREKQPQLWVHGHTHSSCRYNIGQTEVVCNPFGYLGREENPRFNDHMIVDVIVHKIMEAPGDIRG